MRFFLLLPFLLIAACASGSTNPDRDQCQRAGCSQQLCVSRDQTAKTMSTCEWREEYNCYGLFGRCGVQQNGSCGWSDTPDLKACLQNPSGFTGNRMREQLTPRTDPYIERIRPDTLRR